MKKFLTAICSFALVLFMGFAVGCTTTDVVRVRSGSIVTENVTNVSLKVNSEKGTITLTADTKEANAVFENALTFTIWADNSKESNFHAVVADPVTGLQINDQAASAGAKFDFNKKQLKITIPAVSLSGSEVTVCKLTFAQGTQTGEKTGKKLKLTEKTYSVIVVPHVEETAA